MAWKQLPTTSSSASAWSTTVTERLRHDLLAGRDQARRADQGRRAREDASASAISRSARPSAASRPRGSSSRPRSAPPSPPASTSRICRALRPPPDHRVRGDPPLDRVDDGRAGRAQFGEALAELESVASDHDAPRVLGAASRLPLGAARAWRHCLGSARPRPGVARLAALRALFVSTTIEDAMRDHRDLSASARSAPGLALRRSWSGTSTARSSRCARRSSRGRGVGAGRPSDPRCE